MAGIEELDKWRMLLERWSMVFSQEVITPGNIHPTIVIKPNIAEGLDGRIYGGICDALDGTNFGVQKFNTHYDKPTEPGSKSDIWGIGMQVGDFSLYRVFVERGVATIKGDYAWGQIYVPNASSNSVKLDLGPAIISTLAGDAMDVFNLRDRLRKLEFPKSIQQ